MVTSYAFTGVVAPHTIEASFAADGPYTISAPAALHGVVAPAGTVAVTCGAAQTFTISPDSGYHVLDVQVDGISVGVVASYAFSDVRANHSLVASFEQDPYRVVSLRADLAAGNGPYPVPSHSLSWTDLSKPPHASLA